MMMIKNNYRKYFGLEIIDDAWTKIEIPIVSRKEGALGIDYLFFDKNVLKKVISIYDNGNYYEGSLVMRTNETYTTIEPASSKAKIRKLNHNNIFMCKPKGIYFRCNILENGLADICIGNYDSQKTYYSSERDGIRYVPEEFVDKWVTETTKHDLDEIAVWGNESRSHHRYKEGDFFRFRYNRRMYGYGRVLLDVFRWKKSGGEFWDILMGKPLCVSIFRIITENAFLTPEQIVKYKECPSEYIMDNVLYYGDFDIIGNLSSQSTNEYPIMYGRNLSAIDRDKICFSCGKVYRECDLSKAVVDTSKYINNTIGFEPTVNMSVIASCIRMDSNEPFWDNKRKNSYKIDLRDPVNQKDLDEVLNTFGLTKEDIIALNCS
ncbi:immunity 26/phosphotriesterase HocA family protein [Butyrivibrio sp. MC2013]|uniref:immunity 26/phosphotriesterase HocA family protein n=1 Tax=Butyrivibrio sp. MC2013 TaxID=1280686 RepID=UPI0003FA59A3|nr:immunity 26/phosphotriesterase HocA family protein [Butyrivibrio sp. MC2013]